MPLNHEEAAVSIIVTGVSLGCVNPVSKGWEAGFIRHPTHALVLEVTRHAGGEKTVVEPGLKIPTGCTIRVETNDAQTGVTLFKSEGDPEDFGLIIDIENDIYDGIEIPRKQPEHDVTPMFVPSAVLYSVASKQSDFPVRLIVKGDTEANPVKRFGQIGTAAGADIMRENGRETVLRVDGPGGFVLSFPHEEGVRHTLLFDNTCPADTPDLDAGGARSGAGREAGDDAYAGQNRQQGIVKLSRSGEIVRAHSDFVIYYAVLNPPQQKGFFDLVKDINNRGDGAVCNYSHLGRTTSLFPIVE
ncbi:MAG TPA: hypothetical protein VGB98_04455 [Pyrinomonadaceae bacterium]